MSPAQREVGYLRRCIRASLGIPSPDRVWQKSVDHVDIELNACTACIRAPQGCELTEPTSSFPLGFDFVASIL